ncbi:hypothetical protein SAMN02745781_02101 [Vibrio gazogenes DSM 21264]|uniref:Uncharacterized protein n=1 Tax=Vibrio gazogenes DSM 21264 = NBRC 103151 TaxID=1123492 RepID=A0A1M5B5R2_VIBGA|nr:hypothetical protein SAMN02745781_02101 [Vibrio gazogenes DSM 21264] [Vibrio gazogenes DSM 21264 = NBRC 103151]SJN53663.1 hypothetical protein BQ6471_00569 [Vibrio gazogenes]
MGVRDHTATYACQRCIGVSKYTCLILWFSFVTLFESLPDRGAFLCLSENTREDDHDEFAIQKAHHLNL